MPKQQHQEQFIVTITSDKPIKDLCDHVANRLWSMDHVTDVTASRFFHEHGTDIHVVSMPEIKADTPAVDPEKITSVLELMKRQDEQKAQRSTGFVGYMQGREHV